MLALSKLIGEGNHSYLALVLTDVEYAIIPNTQPFAVSVHPLPLVRPTPATLIEALELKEAFNE